MINMLRELRKKYHIYFFAAQQLLFTLFSPPQNLSWWKCWSYSCSKELCLRKAAFSLNHFTPFRAHWKACSFSAYGLPSFLTKYTSFAQLTYSTPHFISVLYCLAHHRAEFNAQCVSSIKPYRAYWLPYYRPPAPLKLHHGATTCKAIVIIAAVTIIRGLFDISILIVILIMIRMGWVGSIQGWDPLVRFQ